MKRGMSRSMIPGINERLRQLVIPVLLVVAVMASAIGSIYAKHEVRKSFMELQGLNVKRDRMEVEWGQLQIEQSTWSTYARVEQLARESMKMRPPTPEEMMLLHQ
jgi:cell division protein FtsL